MRRAARIPPNPGRFCVRMVLEFYELEASRKLYVPRVVSQIMAASTITLEPVSYSSGVPVHYRVLGLANGETADIVIRRVRSIEVWKIKLGPAGRYRGTYRSEEEALSALRAIIRELQ